MRYFFLFFFLMPVVSAIAVTPTSLDFGFVNGIETREVFIANNLEVGADYFLNADNFRVKFIPNSSYLEPGESKIFEVELNSSQLTNGKLNIIIDEVKESSKIINSVKISVKFTTDNKTIKFLIPKINLKDLKVNEERSLEPVKVKKKGMMPEKIVFYVLGIIIIILFIMSRFKLFLFCFT